MEENKQTLSSRIVLGLILIFVGSLFLLSTLNILNIDIPHIIFSFPFFLFVIGILIMVNSRRIGFGGLLTFIGLIFLIPRIFPFIEINSGIVFPVLIIAFGLYIMLRRKSIPYNWHRRHNKETVDLDILDEVAIFSGSERVIISNNFKGGSVTAIFGGSEIDLRSCKLAEGDNLIDVLTLFGGTTLYVPKDWVIKVSVTPIFGGFSNKLRRDPDEILDHTRTLTISGTAIFGGGEIKYV